MYMGVQMLRTRGESHLEEDTRYGDQRTEAQRTGKEQSGFIVTLRDDSGKTREEFIKKKNRVE